MGKVYWWTKEEIIASLQELHRRGIPINKKNINSKYNKDESDKSIICHSTNINKYFGTIKNACDEAGVPCAAIYDLPKRMKEINTIWNKENIKVSLQELHKKIQRPIKGIEIPEFSKQNLVPTADVIRKHFGTIRSACEEASVPYRIYHWTKEDIIQRLQFLDRNYGPIGKIDMKYRFVSEKLLCSAMFIRKIFGSLDIAAKEAGIKLIKQKDYKVPRQGKCETEILNKIEKEKGIKLKRQHFVDKYYIDGYDEVNNVAYEVDEPHHKLRNFYDQTREKYLKGILGCEIIRIPLFQ